MKEAAINTQGEITAIPDLLCKLDIKGAVVTIDVMGCQKVILKK
jgi:predicted transposase YbfD/YdcC